MNYELAKKLKDAGFPQKVDQNASMVLTDCGNIVDPQTLSLIPTLSELIEACGDDISHIKKIGNQWFAVSHTKDYKEGHELFGNNIEEVGDTPEEAVANLWLELNKK